MSFHRSIPLVPSPHFSSRGGRDPEAVILHYTGAGKASGTVGWFANPVSKVSAHFVIARDGHTVQTVELGCAAWHAGVSEMVIRGEAVSGVNSLSIGIELANCGWLYRDKRADFWYELGREMRPYRGPQPIEASLVFVDNGISVPGFWEPYPEEQIDALDTLLKLLRDNGYKTAVEKIRGHEEVAMPLGARKRDPGAVFPWARFGRQDGRRTTVIDYD
jgi:N-acetylmuramoyl-L-alanine amidase